MGWLVGQRNWRHPAAWTLYLGHVDTIEKHRQLGAVEANLGRVVRNHWQAETPQLKPFVVHDKAATIPKQDLATVTPAAEKNEKIPCKQVDLPLIADHGAKAIVSPAHINEGCGQEYPNARGKR